MGVYEFLRRCKYVACNSLGLARYAFFHVSVAKDSRIYDILVQQWGDFRRDLRPNDRRMAVLEELGVEGMSTENIRFLINELVRRFAKEGTYLEVGTYRGCSLLSAAMFNPETCCIGIDNFSGFDRDGVNENILQQNIRKARAANVKFHNKDYKDAIGQIFEQELDLKVDVYFYDGSHTYRDQLDGLEVMLPHLASRCVILVDDVNFGQTVRANRDFLKRHRDFRSVFRIFTVGNCAKDWWNGFEVITRGI